MINLSSRVAPSTNVNLGDMIQIKSALRSLGYELGGFSKNSPFPDYSSFNALKQFQEKEKLTVDGIAKPNGPTVLALNNQLKKSKETIGAFYDFNKNYWDMREANTIGADKYFHCKANFEAASRGPSGTKASKVLSDSREAFGQLTGDSAEDSLEDQKANLYGRNAASSKKYTSGATACESYRPRGLDQKY